MKRYRIPILIVLVLASGLWIGCSSVPPSEAPSEPASNHEATLLTGSASPDYQQRINELEKQIQLLNQKVDALDKELEQEVGVLTQEVNELEESISSLERELETLPATTDSDFEVRIEQRVAQLGEQIDGLNAEVVTIKQQLAEQEAEEEAISPSVTEVPPGTFFTFSGHGLSSSKPFTVTSTPFEIRWEARLEGTSGTTGTTGTTFIVTVVYPEKGTTADSYGYYITEGTTSGQTMSYVQPGTYYFSVNTELYVTWTIWLIELD